MTYGKIALYTHFIAFSCARSLLYEIAGANYYKQTEQQN